MFYADKGDRFGWPISTRVLPSFDMVTLIFFYWFNFFFSWGGGWLYLLILYLCSGPLTFISYLLLLHHPQTSKGTFFLPEVVLSQEYCYWSYALYLFPFGFLGMDVEGPGWAIKGVRHKHSQVISDLLLFLSNFNQRKGMVYGKKRIKMPWR